MTKIGRHFGDTPRGNVRRYWFVGGLGAGVLGVGTIQHWGMSIPNLGLIAVAWVLLTGLLTAKNRGGWDV